MVGPTSPDQCGQNTGILAMCGVSYDLCNVLRISYAYLCNVYYVIITSCVLCNTCHAMLSII